MNEKYQSPKKMRVLHYALLSFLFLCTVPIKAMLGEGSFVGTGGYAIGGTPYYYAGLSYYYDPEMDYYWDGQQWIFKTGAQWPPRCCKPNPCSSCGYLKASGYQQECLPAVLGQAQDEFRPVRVDGGRRPNGDLSTRASRSIEANGESLEECWKVYKNHNKG